MPKKESNATRRHRVSYSQGGGILDAIRLMAERRTNQVVMLAEDSSPVGVFKFQDNRITYETLATPSLSSGLA
jgi:hypothetical protein